MTDHYSSECMLDMYIFETSQNIEQLEMLILETEKTSAYTSNAINEIFRIMHTIKGSSAMMLFNNISSLAHSIEDLFYYMRAQNLKYIDFSILSDLILEGVDFMKTELHKIKHNCSSDGDSTALIQNNKEFLELLKKNNPSDDIIQSDAAEQQIPRFYIRPDASGEKKEFKFLKATIFFQEGCEMENIRAYSITHNLGEYASELFHIPADIIENDESVKVIREEGFSLYIKTEREYDEIKAFLNETLFLEKLVLENLAGDEEFGRIKQKLLNDKINPVPSFRIEMETPTNNERELTSASIVQSMISVNVLKLDKLMDLVGEMVIAEAMVTQNPDLKGLELPVFQKAARQLHKITSELQDMVMSIRMVPLSATFQKMHRIVRDMCRKLGKEVVLELEGEETEVDKNIIEHISDPLMHLVRNAIDHGIETVEERKEKGKSIPGKVALEARNAGSDVLIIVRDDGKGLSKEKILKQANENGLLKKPAEEMTDAEIYNLIFFPGFSTKESISEFSGRGVGMDVVIKNIETVGGSVSVDSEEGIGSVITLKIPLTLAIIDGMNVKVGDSCYTIPTTAIKESFRPKRDDIVTDPDENEMIMVRGQCYPILRLHTFYHVKTGVTDFTEGILVMVEEEGNTLCLFVDALLGQQQVVVKALPEYIRNTRKIRGLAGCTLLGDGSVSLILDVGGLVHKE